MLQETQVGILVRMFDATSDAIPIKYIIKTLKTKHSYEHPGRIVRDALLEGLFYVDKIEDDGTTYLALTDSGEEKWERYHYE